jgi:uncharacterized protein (TIGR02996 family)
MRVRIKVPVPPDLWAEVRARGESQDGFELAQFFDRLGEPGDAAKAGEAMEAWEGRFFSRGMSEFRPGWRLHAALVGRRVVIRAGYCRDEDEEETWRERGLADEYYANSRNEAWAHVFRDDLGREVTLLDEGEAAVVAELEVEGFVASDLTGEEINQRAGLLSAVLDDPDAEAPRLVFADWLDEHGEPERAEFIRLQVEADKEADEQRRAWLEYRAERLLLEHAKRWAPSTWADAMEWRRGFVEWFDAKRWPLPDPGLLFGRHPVRGLVCDLRAGAPLSSVTAFPFAARLRSLTIVVSSLSRSDAEALVRCPDLGGLEELVIRAGERVDEGAIRALTECFADRVTVRQPGPPDPNYSSVASLLDLLSMEDG